MGSSLTTQQPSFSDVQKTLIERASDMRKHIATLKATITVADAEQAQHGFYRSRVVNSVVHCSKKVVQQPDGAQSAGSGTPAAAPGGAAAAADLLAAVQHAYDLPQAPTPISPKSMLSVRACDQEATPSDQDAAPSAQGAAPSDQAGRIVVGLKQYIRCLYQATLAAPSRGPPVSAYSSLKPGIGLKLFEYNTEACEQLEQQRLAELTKLQGMLQESGTGMIVQAAAAAPLQRGVIYTADYAAALRGDPLLPQQGQAGICEDEQPQQGQAPREGVEQLHSQEDIFMHDADQQGEPNLQAQIVGQSCGGVCWVA